MSTPESLLVVESLDHLNETLAAHAISTETWGLDDTKTSSDLYEELLHGESELYVAANGIVKQSWTVKMDVYYSLGAGSSLLRLVESRQTNLETGSSRRRGQFNSISEKQQHVLGESPEEAALRGLAEEIGVVDPFSFIWTSARSWPPKQERNYLGIPTANETNYFVAQLARSDFRVGYEERQPKKITYFNWEVVKPGKTT